MADGASKQKEWFSRAWIVAAAASANFTYQIVADDERGVDMTVHGGGHTLDFQLKATSNPDLQDGYLIHDLDVRTYNLLRSPTRSAHGVLALVVLGPDATNWHVPDHESTRLAKCAYYLPLIGMPSTTNVATVRLRVPVANLLTADAMQSLMNSEAARWQRNG